MLVRLSKAQESWLLSDWGIDGDCIILDFDLTFDPDNDRPYVQVEDPEGYIHTFRSLHESNPIPIL